MNYTLLVLADPASGHANRTAAAFAGALLERGHSLLRVFFLDAAARTGDALAVLPQDEESPLRDWQTLAANHGVELVLCVSSALRRGLLDRAEAERYEKAAANLADGFVISGLGQLVDACARSDRVVTFGG